MSLSLSVLWRLLHLEAMAAIATGPGIVDIKTLLTGAERFHRILLLA